MDKDLRMPNAAPLIHELADALLIFIAGILALFVAWIIFW